MRPKLISMALLLALTNLAQAGPRARPLKIFIMAGQSNAVGHGSNTFLETNAPYRLLVEGGYIAVKVIAPGEEFSLPGLRCRALEVPHRNEVADTVGYSLMSEASGATAVYIPDMDRWTDEALDEVRRARISLVDGTFYSGDEVPRFGEVPHPPVQETVERLAGVEGEVHFTHLNHTNPLNMNGDERKRLEEMGFRIACDGLTLNF